MSRQLLQILEWDFVRLSLEKAPDPGNLHLCCIGSPAAAHERRGQPVEQTGPVHQFDIDHPTRMLRLKPFLGDHVVVVVGARKAPVGQSLPLFLRAKTHQTGRNQKKQQHHQLRLTQREPLQKPVQAGFLLLGNDLGHTSPLLQFSTP